MNSTVRVFVRWLLRCLRLLAVTNDRLAVAPFYSAPGMSWQGALPKRVAWRPPAGGSAARFLRR